MSYLELYETKRLLDDVLGMMEQRTRLYEAANLGFYQEKNPWLTKQEFDKVCAIDPTANKAYSKWLMDRYVSLVNDKNSNIDPKERKRLFFEDAEARELPAAIKLFDKIKVSRKGLINTVNHDIANTRFGMEPHTDDEGNYHPPSIDRERGEKSIARNEAKATLIQSVKDEDIDIMKKSIIDLLDMMDPFIAAFKEDKDVFQTKKELVVQGLRILFEDDHWLVTIPETFEASQKIGGGTTYWCTAANRDHYDYYTEKIGGPLISIVDKTKNHILPSRSAPGYPSDKYQLHLSSDQFKGASDQEVGAANRTKIIGAFPPEVQQILSKLGFNRYTYELQSLFQYGTSDKAPPKQQMSKKIRDLIAHDANPHIQSEAVLKWAVKNGDLELADMMLNDKDTSRSVIADLVTDAASSGNFEMVEKIVGIVGPEAINANGGRAFIAACKFPIEQDDNTINEKVKKAVRTNADLPKDRREPVGALVERLLGPGGMTQYNELSQKIEAYYVGAEAIIHYFVEHGADPNSQNGEALGNLCRWSSEVVLRLVAYLLDHGAEVNINSSLPYWTAFNNCRPRVLQLLVSRGGAATAAPKNK